MTFYHWNALSEKVMDNFHWPVDRTICIYIIYANRLRVLWTVFVSYKSWTSFFTLAMNVSYFPRQRFSCFFIPLNYSNYSPLICWFLSTFVVFTIKQNGMTMIRPIFTLSFCVSMWIWPFDFIRNRIANWFVFRFSIFKLCEFSFDADKCK